MTKTGVMTGERVIEKIPIMTLFSYIKEDYGKVMEFLKQNEGYACSILFIRKQVFNDEMPYWECQQLLKKMYDKGYIHRANFINVMYYWSKY